MQIRWGQQGYKRYQTGVDRGVLYLKGIDGFTKAYPWNGLVNITDKPTGGEPTPLYADDVKYLNLMSVEDYGYSIEAYTYPEEFSRCDGSYEIGEGVYAHQQEREVFGLSYRNMIGDESGGYIGYILHLIYNGTASVSERTYASLSDSVEPETMSWDVATVPVEIAGFMPSSWIAINSMKCDKKKLQKIEDILYGSLTTDPRLPMPEEVIEIFTDSALYPFSTLYPAQDILPKDR